MYAVALCTQLCTVLAALLASQCVRGIQVVPWRPLATGSRDDTSKPSVTVDLGKRHPLSKNLYGAFFEEINHAGDGGLYAELVQDRSFDALAAATGFLSNRGRDFSPLTLQEIDLAGLAATHRRATDSIAHPWRSSNGTGVYHSKQDRLSLDAAASDTSPRGAIVVAWSPLPGTKTALTSSHPLNEHNTVAMELTAPGGGQNSTAGPGGIVNSGYWGISVAKGEWYSLSLFLQNPQALGLAVTVSLMSADLKSRYADFTVEAAGGGEWARYAAEAQSSGTDADARLVITFPGPATTLIVDSVSLYPRQNVAKGAALGLQNPWPFRTDLLQTLKDLSPAFIRMPGGCYVEGDWMYNAFRWKPATGPNEARPGHMNGVWGYWSTDGLGLFEYMLLAEELGAEAVWVVNNGVAHGDSVPPAAALPLVQDALDSIEFITGAPDSKWGAVRAAMGHVDPWPLNYVAIGNEDCGKPWYTENYNLFYGAISTRYPHMRLISNCDMGAGGPTDLWDYHVYTNPLEMFNLRRQFDGRDPNAGHFVFASEYAVTDGGGKGNLIGAVAEAAFMTGLERNGEAVQMAAFAPLMVNWNDRRWPTNLIAFDNHRAFGIPSYHVQSMFRKAQGTHYVSTQVTDAKNGSDVHQETVAASATCQGTNCTTLVLKLVNFAPYSQVLPVELVDSSVAGGGDVAVGQQGEAVELTSAHPEDENSFDEPFKVAPAASPASGLSSRFSVQVQAYSVNLLTLHLGAPAAQA